MNLTSLGSFTQPSSKATESIGSGKASSSRRLDRKERKKRLSLSVSLALVFFMRQDRDFERWGLTGEQSQKSEAKKYRADKSYAVLVTLNTFI